MSDYYGIEPKFIGKNNASNGVSTSAVVSNADGTVLERLEYLQTAIGGSAGQLRFQQSASNVVEDDSFAQFEVTLIDVNSGAITSTNINIASITVELSKSTGGGAFSAVGITQPTFSKADGRVYTSNRFLAAEWSVGDVYKLTIKDIVVTFGTEYAYVPMMVWCNIITDIIDIDTIVDDIKTQTSRIHETAVTVGMVAGSLSTFIAGNNGGLGSQLPASTSLYDVVKYLANVADGGTVTPTKVLDNSILAIILSKVSGGDISSFDNSTDSMEAISDKITDVNTDIGNFSARANLQSLLTTLGVPDTAGKDLYTCLITDRLDNATFGLSAIETLVDDVESEMAKVPKSDSNVTWNSTALASINAEVDTALNTIVPASPTAGSINDILSKASGGNTFDKATDSLEAIADAVASGSRTVAGTGAGTTTTIIDSSYSQANDYWNGCVIVALTGNNAGQARIVTDFDSATNTFTVTPAFGTATASSETYSLISGMSLYENIKNISTIGVTAAPVANTLADTLHKDSNFSYDNTTDSLEAIRDAIDAGFALTGDAVVGEVLDGKFFYKDNYQTKLEGTMPNNAGDVASVSAHMDAGTVLHVVPAEGYTDGSDDATTIDLTTVDADLVTGNIKSGVTILGVAGSSTVKDVSDWTDAVEGDVASGKKFYKADGSQATGTHV